MPSALGLALVYLTVQRASRSFWRSLAGVAAHCGGMRPSLMSRFSPSVLRCLGAATIEASMIWPLIAKNPAVESAVSKRSNRTSIAGFPAIRARVSASRKVHIVLASGTVSASPRPRNRRQPVPDQVFGAFVRQIVAGLQNQRLEHQHMI